MDQSLYFSWVRKGLGTYIDEKDSLGGDGKTLGRPEVTVKSNYTARHNQPKEGEKEEDSGVVLEKTVKFIGPGDILKVRPSAVMKVHPDDGTEGFPNDYIPYLEFWEPDFLWRYTPASQKNDKLRPWLALITLKKEDVRLETTAELPYFTFIGDDKAWAAAFPAPGELHLCAHAQGNDAGRPDFCRLLGMRNEELEEGTDYIALLVPSFETGRLRGLGIDEEEMLKIPAQRPSWESSFSSQKSNRKRGAEFPVYYHWSFKAGKDSFDTIAGRLRAFGVKKSGLLLDVTDMGEGFSYNTIKHSSSRTSIVMPAATKTIDFKEEPAFPMENSRKYATEKDLYNNLHTRLEKNPVFIENQADIAGVAISDQDSEDPWVVPPVYGARHAMSTSLDDKEKPWLKELNMDIHHRTAAGLGRKIVQQHQEEFMDRAWMQVEAVQALNMELYERLLSIRANQALRAKTVDQFTDPDDNTKYIEYMMRYLASMKDAGADKHSLSSILSKADIPASFASPAFQNNVERLSRIVDGLDNATLMDQIVKDQIFRFTQQEPVGALDPKKIIRWCENGEQALYQEAYERYWTDFLSLKYNTVVDSDQGMSHKISVSTKKLSLTIKETRTVGDTLELSVNAPIRFLEKQILDTCLELEPGYINSPSFDALKKAFLAFNSDSFHTYPRVYSMDDELFTDMIPDGYMSESGIGLTCVNKGQGHILSPKALVIPSDLINRGLPLASPFVRWKNTSYELVNLEKFYKLPYAWMTVYRLPGNDTSNCQIRTPNEKLNCRNCVREGKSKDWKHEIDTIIPYEKDPGNLKSLLIELVKECRGSVSTKEYEPFKNDAVNLFADDWFLSWDSKRETLIVDEKKKKAFLANYRSILDGNIGNKDLAQISFTDLKKFISGILSTILDYKSMFEKVAGKAFDGRMAVASLCYLEVIGPWMLFLLAHCLADTQTGKEMKSTFEKIDAFILSNPSFTIIKQSDYDGRRSYEDYDPFKSLSYTVSADFPEEKAFLTKIKDEADNLAALQKQPVEDASEPINNTAVNQLQEEFENKYAYDRIKSIAYDYYKDFFSDGEEGLRLREGYLDKLLMSKYPILAYPFFPEPTYYYLNMLSDKFIIPGLDEMPMDSIAMFKSNPQFTEAFLCGMNTEMGSELQWREYPTDRRGSYFRKFWDSESSVQAIRNDSFFDIRPVHLWGETKLGENHQNGKGNLLIFAIHSELFKLYPGTRVYLNKADSDLGFGTERIDPVMETFAREDILLVGFKNLDVPNVIGNPEKEDYGYLLAFEQDVDDLNFFQKTEGVNSRDTAADRANKLQDRVTIFGKHVSRFVTV